MNLKNCPFCEESDIMVEREYMMALNKVVGYFVWCNKCKIAGPEANTELKAIKKWNGKRTGL